MWLWIAFKLDPFTDTVWHREKCNKIKANNSKDIRLKNMKQTPQERIYSQVSFCIRDASIILFIIIVINVLQKNILSRWINLLVSNFFSLLNSTTQINVHPKWKEHLPMNTSYRMRYYLVSIRPYVFSVIIHIVTGHLGRSYRNVREKTSTDLTTFKTVYVRLG